MHTKNRADPGTKSAVNPLLLIGGVLTTLLWFFLVEAGGDLENEVRDIRFAPHPTFSRLIIEMTRPFNYSLRPDFKKERVTLTLRETRIAGEFKKRKITDARIKGVRLKESKETGDLVITILLRYRKNSIYHLSLEGPPRLVLDIQKKNGRIRGSAESVLHRKHFPELEEKGETPVLSAGAEKEAGPRDREARPKTGKARQAVQELSPEEVARRRQVLQDMKRKNLGKPLYTEGLKLYQQTRYTKAYLSFKKFIEQFPKSPYAHNAYYLMGDCRFHLVKKKKPDYTAAIHDYRTAIRHFPRSPHKDAALFKLGQMYFSQGLKLEARASFDEILQEFPKKRYELQVKLKKADMHYAEQEYKKAYQLYKEVVKLSPYSPEAKSASFAIADYLYDTKNYKQAMLVYLEAAKRWPTYPRIHPHIVYNIGNLFYINKDLKEARKYFYTLVNTYPHYEFSMQAMKNLGDSYLQEGKDAAGMKIFSETAGRNPGTPEARYGRLRLAEIGVKKAVYHPKKKIFKPYEAYYDPLKTFREISEKSPDDPGSAANALLHEGEALSKKREFFKAIATFRKIHEKFPETAQSKEVKRMIQDSFYEMVRVYYGQKGFLPLLEAYHENLEPYLRDARNPKVLFMIADVYQKIGLYDTAVRHYQRIRALDKKGEFRDAMIVRLSAIHLQRGSLKEAENALTKFIAGSPKSPYLGKAFIILGDALFRQKKLEKAAGRYEEFIQRFPRAPERSRIYARLGNVRKEQKKYSQAIKAFQNSIKEFKPEDPAGPLPAFYTKSFYKIGDCYYLNGEYRLAVKAYQEAVAKFKDEPKNLYAKYFIGESYAKLQEEKTAESLLKNVSEVPRGAIWSRAAALTRDAMKWAKGYEEIL